MKPARIEKQFQMPVSWSDIPSGEQYRQALQYHLRPWWPKMFGFHLLKLGHLSTEIDTDECMISHQFSAGNGDPRFHVIAEPLALPFANKSVDACLMSHMLAYNHDPHWVLREVDRVLMDDGWLIISGFNPFSLLGMGKMVPILRKQQPYCSRLFPTIRISDWLSLLNYEVLFQRNCQAFPWFGPENRLNQYIAGVGALNIIVARKRTSPLTPMSLKFKQQKMKIGTALGATKRMTDRSKNP